MLKMVHGNHLLFANADVVRSLLRVGIATGQYQSIKSIRITRTCGFADTRMAACGGPAQSSETRMHHGSMD